MWSIAVSIEETWAKAISKDRDYKFLLTATASSMISLAPFSIDAAFSDFLIYALLLIVLVFSNRDRFTKVAPPSFSDLAIASGVIVGSFAVNYLLGCYTGNYEFGVTDYAILSCGLFGLFYSVSDSLARLGIVVLITLRGATLGLSIAYPWLFAGVSAFFVTIVLTVSNVFVSRDIWRGSEPGQIVVGGASNGGVVEIGWACAGLEELVVTGAVLFVLIYSFRLSSRANVFWMIVGISGSFVVNVIRMVILVWVAFAYGMDEMTWVHTHIGDALFLAWIALFWAFFFRVTK